MSSARDPEQLVDPGPHLLRPRLGSEHPGRQRQAAPCVSPASANASPSLIAYDGVQVRICGRRSVMSSNLARRHPAGHRNDGRAQLDRALVDAEPAGEQAIAVRVVHDRARPGAGRGERPRAHPGPQLDVGPGVGDQRRAAAGAARPVHGDDLVARDGEQAERVVVPQVLLGGGRQAGQVVEADIGAAVTPASRSRLAWRPPAASSRSISPRSRSVCRTASSSAGIDSASGSNIGGGESLSYRIASMAAGLPYDA